MRVAGWVLLLCCALAISAADAAAQDKVELFGGYSFVRASVPVTATILCPTPTCPATTANYHASLNGWEFAGTYKTNRWLGLTGDLGGQYGTIGTASTHLQTYLFGPTISLPSRVSPFAHVLFGGAHEAVGNGLTGTGSVTLPTSGNFFAIAAGAGIDVKVAPLIAVRLIQIDYLATRAYSTTQNQPRISAGVVVHF